MNATTFVASGYKAAFSRHEDWDGLIIVCHGDDQCPFIFDGDPVPGLLPTDRWADCQFCVGGNRYSAPCREVLTDHTARIPDPPRHGVPQVCKNRIEGITLTDEDVAAWLLGLGRKVEPEEVTGAHVLAAERWLAAYTGDFAFLLDVRAKARRGLSNGQAKGVLNCWRAELNRNAAKAAPVAAPAPPTGPAEVVPAGHYAVQSRTGNNDLDFYRVDHGKGQWAGRVFVKRIIGGTPDQNVRGAETKLALEAIAKAGPEAAATLYGQELGQCSRCNRHLTDETSRALGIGPECRKM